MSVQSDIWVSHSNVILTNSPTLRVICHWITPIVAAVTLGILSLVAVGSPVAFANDEQAPSVGLLLVIKTATASQPGSLLVTGHGFSPGGEVYVALYDQWGMELFETRWVTASGVVYGPNGTQDLSTGFNQGGTINEIFDGSWAIYGPNGSRDPAMGHKEGTAVGSICGATVMVRALDQVSDSWSNVLDVDVDC